MLDKVERIASGLVQAHRVLEGIDVEVDNNSHLLSLALVNAFGAWQELRWQKDKALEKKSVKAGYDDLGEQVVKEADPFEGDQNARDLTIQSYDLLIRQAYTLADKAARALTSMNR